MAFIEPVPESEASEAAAQMYATDREIFGHVPNFTHTFSRRGWTCGGTSWRRSPQPVG
jgi:hypothetical protein